MPGPVQGPEKCKMAGGGRTRGRMHTTKLWGEVMTGRVEVGTSGNVCRARLHRVEPLLYSRVRALAADVEAFEVCKAGSGALEEWSKSKVNHAQLVAQEEGSLRQLVCVTRCVQVSQKTGVLQRSLSICAELCVTTDISTHAHSATCVQSQEPLPDYVSHARPHENPTHTRYRRALCHQLQYRSPCHNPDGS
jgi:hypothetical protein